MKRRGKKRERERKKKPHTPRPPRAHGPIARIRPVAPNIPDLGVQQPFALKRLAEEVLDAPEAAGGHGAFLRVGRDLDGGGVAVGVEGHAGRCGVRAEEAGEEVWHCGGHYDEEEGGGDEDVFGDW